MNVCITGASGKLGKALLVATDWNVLPHFGRRYGSLCDEEHVMSFAATAQPLDALICAAGGKRADGAVSFQEMLNDNLLTTYLTCKHFLPKMKPNSTILTIGSVDGCFGQAEGSFYASAKAALHVYTRCLAKQVPNGIRVNCLALGTLTEDNIEGIARTILQFCQGSAITGQVIRVDNGHHTFAC